MAVAQTIFDLTLEELTDQTLQELLQALDTRLEEIAGMQADLEKARQRLVEEVNRRQS